MSFQIETIPNRNSPPAILLRKAWREGKFIRKKTLGNLSQLPPDIVEGFRRVLKGGVVLSSPEDAFVMEHSLPYGHVAAVLGVCRQLGLPQLLHRSPDRMRNLALAGLIAQVLTPLRKRASMQQFSSNPVTPSLSVVLGLGAVDDNELPDMLDWLGERQPWVERGLARRHLQDATLVVANVASHCPDTHPLAQSGHSRDDSGERPRVGIGLLCSGEGCPIAAEVFAGNAAGAGTVSAQVHRLKKRFPLARVVLTGDRGMLAIARIRRNLLPEGLLDWIVASEAADLRKLLGPVCSTQSENPRPDTVAEIFSPDFPGERLLVCLNPRLREECERKREELLAATEAILQQIAERVHCEGSRLRGVDKISRSVEREAKRHVVEKYFDIAITDNSLLFRRDKAKVAAEAHLDGIHIVRTRPEANAPDDHQVVQACKSLWRVECAFRAPGTFSWQKGPMHADSPDRMHVHLFLRTLACFVEWHMRKRLAPMLFEGDDTQDARTHLSVPVKPARTSTGKSTVGGLPVRNLPTLLENLATLTLHTVRLPDDHETRFAVTDQPTLEQRRAFELIEVDPTKTVLTSTYPDSR